MNRYTIIIVIIFVTIFLISLAIILSTTKGRDASGVLIKLKSAGDNSPHTRTAFGVVQTKYNHSFTTSNGSGTLFNDKTLCKFNIMGDKIVSGLNAELGDVPSIALLEYLLDSGDYSFDCGGALINHRYVLTAAHCLLNKFLINVRLGEHDINKPQDCDKFNYCHPEPLNVGIEKTLVHEEYSEVDFKNDIGLIRLSIDVPYVQYAIKPICIPYDNMSTPQDQLVLIAGWGSNGTTKHSSILQIAWLSPYNWNVCRTKYAPVKIIFPSQMCAGGKINLDACNRDSGGPLIMTINGTAYVEGIVSFGNGCAKEGWPGVYTRVGYFYDWIVNNLKP